jgi:hypothetical protein
MDADVWHPARDQLEGAAFGWLADDETCAIWAHAARCPRCATLLAADDEVRRRLLLLRAEEPRIEVLPDVLRQISAERERAPRRAPLARRPFVAALVLAVSLGLAGLLLAPPGALQAAATWLQRTIVREVLPPGQLGAPATRIGTSGASGPLRRVSLEEARRLARFPVALPQTVPAGFAPAEVTVFQTGTDVAPSQVFVTYHRPGAAQPLVLTYRAPDGTSEVTAPPEAARELVVAGYRAIYIDTAARGAQPATGSPVALQPGSLIVERPDVVLAASGDRRDGLDVDALAAVLGSVP